MECDCVVDVNENITRCIGKSSDNYLTKKVRHEIRFELFVKSGCPYFHQTS